MNIYFDIESIDSNNIYYISPIKNKLVDKLHFYKLFYSASYFTLNSLFIHMTLHVKEFKFIDNKIIAIMKSTENLDIISKVRKLEYQILQRNKMNKEITFGCHEQLSKGFIYINNPNNLITDKSINKSIFLKISGVWESDNAYGLSFKFCMRDIQSC